ncbi:unnamed protein product (macronuclear) [Paramecium tetraurelia]|uniref:Pantothenate kinase n=1 Tax=Paramecium tetraurelia TaxID=5888 RepID=A0DQ03_PARTE|nr:uncharacterized protein GSPATT00002520001 [Paramecium tetraurelia]CAK85120.1 unnamed protein product [Paramecium tetraurelia]|eukprot:XP_001452517.1 hypothetical protein (macronuclear) [Paramecium tetraurelia strain d4-2]
MQNNPSFSQNLIPIVCLDIGGTLTKLTFATKKGVSLKCQTKKELNIINETEDYEIHFISHPNSLDKLIENLEGIGFIVDGKSYIQNFYITGGGSFKYYDQISNYGKIIRINEFDALKFGFKLLDSIKCKNTYFTFNNGIEYLQLTASIYPFILVNIGSGVSILKFDNEDQFARISGTSLGGGMFLGLSHLFTGINDFDELLKMTKQGSNAHTDLLMDEVHLGFQSPTRNKNEKHVAVSMGKLDQNININKSDLVKSLLYMTTYNISQIAFLHSKLHNIERVFFSGHFIRNHEETLQCINEAFSYFSKLDQQNRHPYFIKHDGFIGSLGSFWNGIQSFKQGND